MKKSIKILLIIAGALVILGGIMAISASASIGFNFGSEAFYNNRNYEKTTHQITINELNSIDFTLTNASVEIIQTLDEDISITYYDHKNIETDYSFKDGKVTLERKHNKNDFWFGFNFGINLNDNREKVVIRLPKHIEISSLFNFNNCAVDMENLDFNSNVTLDMTNGVLDVENITALTDFVISSTNTAIDIENINSENLNISAHNAVCTVEDIRSLNTTVFLTNNVSNLEFVGAYDDYTINNNSSTSIINIEDKLGISNGKAYTLDISSTNGVVNLDFFE